MRPRERMRKSIETRREVGNGRRPERSGRLPLPTSRRVSIDFLMRSLGRIVRLQIQRSTLKTGEKPTRVYDPAPILAVPRLAVGRDGVLGEGSDGSWLVDVHHRAHPDTKNEDGAHGVSPGFTSHYALMQQRVGDRIVPGCPGQDFLVGSQGRVAPD